MTTQAATARKGAFGFNRNIILYLVMLFIANLGFGVVGAGFNLYILSMGMSPDILGVILSLTPFAQMLMAIPIGFLAEKIGNKRGMILINLVVGIAYFMRVISGNQALILAGSFLLGTVQSGYFIMQMPFISHYAGTGKRQRIHHDQRHFLFGHAARQPDRRIPAGDGKWTDRQ